MHTSVHMHTSSHLYAFSHRYAYSHLYTYSSLWLYKKLYKPIQHTAYSTHTHTNTYRYRQSRTLRAIRPQTIQRPLNLEEKLYTARIIRLYVHYRSYLRRYNKLCCYQLQRSFILSHSWAIIVTESSSPVIEITRMRDVGAMIAPRVPFVKPTMSSRRRYLA